jgi:diguanylate cyclase (GGDEF)-like protein/PAS domain S-box-containing protein
LLSTAAATLLATSVYESVKQFAFPDLTPWQSHAVTIVFVTLMAVLTAHFLSRVTAALQTRARVIEWARERSESALRAFVDALPEPAFLLDRQRRVIIANAAIAKRMGCTVDQLIGRDLIKLLPNRALADARTAGIESAMQTRRPLVFHDRNGERCYANHIYPVQDSSGEAWAVAVFAMDITELKETEQALALANRELLKAAERDPLTGLYNRRFLDTALEREIKRAQRHGVPLGILIADVDHFKRVNDMHGHAAGDDALKAVANYLMSNVRSEDVVCRYGGEEFVVLMPGASGHVARERAEALREGVRGIGRARHDWHLSSVSISVGVAIFPEHAADREGLLQAADAALYRAKSSGRDRVEMSGGAEVVRSEA